MMFYFRGFQSTRPLNHLPLLTSFNNLYILYFLFNAYNLIIKKTFPKSEGGHNKLENKSFIYTLHFTL